MAGPALDFVAFDSGDLKECGLCRPFCLFRVHVVICRIIFLPGLINICSCVTRRQVQDFLMQGVCEIYFVFQIGGASSAVASAVNKQEGKYCCCVAPACNTVNTVKTTLRDQS